MEDKYFPLFQFSCSCQSCLTLCDPMGGRQHARPPCPSQTQSLLKLMPIEPVMPSNHLIFCCPLFLLPSIFPSIRVLYKELGGQSVGVSASTSVLPVNTQDWSLRMDWLDLLAVQGNLKSSPPQFFSTQLSSPSNSHTHTWPLEKP